MISYIQAIILGAAQGISELFPVSSLGHSVILPPLLGWSIDQGSDVFLIFLVATHLATSLVLLGFFFKDWVKIIGGIFKSLKNRFIDPADSYQRLGWIIVVATVPAGLLGLFFENTVKALFNSPVLVSVILILNGIMLYGAEFLRMHSARTAPLTHSDEAISWLTWMRTVKIGLAQALALLPGISRTGATIGGGLLVGLDHLNAARLSFLLATPIIFAAAVLKLPELIVPGNAYPIGPIVAGAVAAAIAAYVSVKFLVKYFKTKTLKPFALYCVIAGALSFVILLVR